MLLKIILSSCELGSASCYIKAGGSTYFISSLGISFDSFISKVACICFVCKIAGSPKLQWFALLEGSFKEYLGMVSVCFYSYVVLFNYLSNSFCLSMYCLYSVYRVFYWTRSKLVLSSTIFSVLTSLIFSL